MSSRMSALWNSWGRGGQVAAIGAAVIVLGLILWIGFRAMHEDYGVLFTDLTESDASAIVKQLKKDKVPYRLADNGTTVQVPAEQVHDVRLTVMSGDLPLSGGVGFEIFDKQGLGATEHSQKVSYQRALQGELARTIATMNNVRQVRVHLVMPESTLFTRDRQQASAAVAITLEQGASLDRQQILGVQRLVAASVAGLEASRVVITDQRGVSLAAADSGGAAGVADARLQVKRDIEDYMTHKIVRLLDSAFGPGQAIVSVDVSLNFDATKTTIQDLLPAEDADGAGRIVRRRQVTGSSTPAPMWTNATTEAAAAAAPRTPSSTTEVEYEYGRRIDEVIAAPGALSRLNVGVIVPGEVSDEKRARISELVRVAAGIDSTRGDAVSVQPLSQIGAAATASDAVPVEANDDAAVSARAAAPDDAKRTSINTTVALGALAGLVIALLAAVLFMHFGRRSLSAREREQLLEDLRHSLGGTQPVTGRSHS
ncbi:flagellar basal-body MS-ring/collar protein FliF [Steroidobacter flavus]|uniref:Flagellar M-ring protein n=1 Tax=Steroidobacter flavus TaxID=1842136 RepID=A0ABV8T026_9GAMM